MAEEFSLGEYILCYVGALAITVILGVVIAYASGWMKKDNETR